MEDRNDAQLQIEKKRLRREMLKLRDALSPRERERAAVLLTERILGHQWFYRSEILLGFVSYGSEIDTRMILEEAFRKQKRVYLPRVEGEKLVFYRTGSLEELREGYKGILEPDGCTEVFDIERALPDKTLMLMPGVAFDLRRNRMGYGKGFYDRYLRDKPDLQLRTIALGYACQLIGEVPCTREDIRPYQVICV
ncbi:MAG: 5-formyltetrahydrofolate cyclo-ligase [Roseburia sp.]|nr:5-formyltetrahydrofolate cyclo-ligase [Roseburia sp.]